MASSYGATPSFERQRSRSFGAALGHEGIIEETNIDKQLTNSLDEGSKRSQLIEQYESLPILGKPRRRSGDTISAVLTLCKAMFNAGCFSLPFAWKLGGLWASLILQLLISLANWHGNRILVRTAQHMTSVYDRSALDYGHFTKYVLDLSGIPHLQRCSKRYMYVVNAAILFYQLGMGSVAVLFIAENMRKAIQDTTNTDLPIIVCATIALAIVLATNMVVEMRIISIFAGLSTLFFITGAAAILAYCWSIPNQWATLPALGSFYNIITFIGMAMYSYEGQTMILPIENKLEYPEDFLSNCGVLSTTMLLATALLTALGFYGYTAFGAQTATTITLNLPPHFTAVTICLMVQSALGHCLVMYPVFDMFGAGFRRKFPLRFPWWTEHTLLMDRLFRMFSVLLTYLLAMTIPKLDILIPLVGVTSGTLCAFVFPPLLETIVFWRIWKRRNELWYKLGSNIVFILLGLFVIVAGLITNCISIYHAFAGGHPLSG